MNPETIAATKDSQHEADMELAKAQAESAKGFPVDTLPDKVRPFVEECAAALPAAPDLVALPTLVTVGAAIGNTRLLTLKDGWDESAALYAAIVADTGAMKSPALKSATQPILDAQQEGRRTWTSDTTVEKLGSLLQENERGLLLIRDELLGWVRSLNQYKSGKGADREFYLSAWGSAPITVDRKSSGTIHVPRPFLAVVGGLPPDRLSELGHLSGGDDGFIERLLFAWPEPIQIRWTDRVVSSEAKSAYHTLVKDLLEIQCQATPVQVRLSQDAQSLFQVWHDRHCEEMKFITSPPGLRGFYAKLKGYCARLALIHAFMSNPSAGEVGKESVVAAIQQVGYFKAQAAKVTRHLYACRYVGVGVDKPKAEVERCKDGIRRKLRKQGPLSKRALQRSSQFNADVFNAAWESIEGSELAQLNGTFTLKETIRRYPAYRQTDTDTRSPQLSAPTQTDGESPVCQSLRPGQGVRGEGEHSEPETPPGEAPASVGPLAHTETGVSSPVGDGNGDNLRSSPTSPVIEVLEEEGRA